MAAAGDRTLPILVFCYLLNCMDNNGIHRIIDILRRYVTLNLDYARLTAAEKLTILLSTVAFYMAAVAMGTVALIFISVGVGHLLASTCLGEAAYLYVAAFYLLVFVLLIVFRRRIFIDPICRFITRLLVKPPVNE